MDVLISMPEIKELFHDAAKITHDIIFLFHDNKIITHDAATKFSREFEAIAVR